MSVPVKFREIGDFHEYYGGKRKAPYLTIFIGGNHEASSHMWELYYGGWAAPNIFYMGAANVLRLGPVRIAGMSGIWKGYNYNKTHHERLPYNQDDVKSIYHIREYDVRKLLQLRTQVDIGISHDWPRAIEKHGDAKRLWRMKPDFERESAEGTLGNQAAAYVMDRLRPPYWFSAHLHCKFPATKTYESVSQRDGPREIEVEKPHVEPASISAASIPADATAKNEDEIDLDMDDDDMDDDAAPATSSSNAVSVPSTETVPDDIRALLPAAFSRPPPPTPKVAPGQPPPPAITNKTVRFLALDKCLPGRKFLQLLPIVPESTLESATNVAPAATQPRYRLEYDPEWLAITRVFASSLVLGDRNAKNPSDLGEAHYLALIEKEEQWIEENVTKKGKLTVPDDFSITAPVFEEGMPVKINDSPVEYTSPQTAAFCELVGIENPFHATEEERQARMSRGPDPDQPRGDHIGGRGRGRGFGGRGGGRGGGGRGRGGRGKGRGRGWH
jgi:lariat debranching enzyme